MMVGGNNLPEKSSELARSKATIAVMCTAGLGLLLCLVYIYTNQVRSTTPAVVTTAIAQEDPQEKLGDPEQQNPAQETPQRVVSPGEVLEGLKRFQRTTGSSIGYDEYEEELTQLSVLVDEAVLALGPANHAFRLEAEAAVRDYIAAGKWWKTTIRNNTVFSDADRIERTQAIWNSAKSHVENAEKVLVR